MEGPGSGERIIAHLAFARAVAARSLDPRCRGADREDLIAWGVVGLVQAAQRYRGELGASFGAYAARRVRGQVLDALRARDPLTRSARRAYREAQRIAEDLPPPYVEISLDRLAELGDGGIATPDALAEAGAPRDPRWQYVAREVRSLSQLERHVIVLSYARGLTLREIGTEVGLSESGVCRVRARALRHLRSALGEEQEAA
ncbi:MAG TPA: sigma-70 family RNA polymerase sigma factor [Candidatus Limnocylindria bacterium]|jgi:RNA polymerase sigma factor for flagellar operon FliA|nr:sigma-70 family RNA polymerase sigma factor [Candidatus Limnocylindria bacterium]